MLYVIYYSHLYANQQKNKEAPSDKFWHCAERAERGTNSREQKKTRCILLYLTFPMISAGWERCNNGLERKRRETELIPEQPGRGFDSRRLVERLGKKKQKHTNNDKQSVLDTLPLAQTFMYYRETEKKNNNMENTTAA